MPFRLSCALICFVAAVVRLNAAGAQSSKHVDVNGRVVDAATEAPLRDAHVFIAESTIGAVTTADGRFHLRLVPAGSHTLYVSMLGYAPVRIDTLFRADGAYRFLIKLSETVLEGPEVTVTAERNPSWYRRLDKFTRIFIGESPNAEACTIENPEVLSFDTRWWGRLSAEARGPLVITNRSLGYRVTYYLEEFEAEGGTIRWDGEPFFEELSPADSAEARRGGGPARPRIAAHFDISCRACSANPIAKKGLWHTADRTSTAPCTARPASASIGTA